MSPPNATAAHPQASVGPSVLIALRTATVAGAERLVLEELSHLAERFRVNVIVLQSSESADSELAAVSEIDPRQLLAGSHDLVHTHLFLPGLLARLRRIWDPSFRWVHSIHYGGYDGLSFPWIRRWLDTRWIFPATDALVAVSPAVMEAFGRLPQAVLIENALDLAPDEDPGPRAAGDPDAARTTPIVGTVAMLRTEKGLADLIDAAALLRDRGEEFRLKIAGDGPLRAELQARIRRAGLSDRVEMCGYVSDLPAFYRSLAVYVQPSVSESFGLAALDALRYRRPIVATDAGNLPSVLGEGRFGVVVPRGNDVAGALADGIAEALSRREELSRRAEAGRAHWAERLDPAARARRTAEVYRRALEPRLCFVAPLATHGGGGLQRQVAIQTRALRARGNAVCLVQRRDERLERDPAHRERWNHITLLPTPDLFGRRATGGFWERLRGAAFVGLALARLVGARARYDVIQAQQLYSPTLVGALAKRLLGKPLVVRVTASGHLGELREIGRLPFRGLRNWAFRQVDRVIVLTAAMRAEVLQLGFEPRRVVLVPNGVEMPPDPAPAEPLEGRPFRLVYVGRLSTEKSLETLLAAAGILADEGRDVEVTLVGGPSPQRNSAPALEEQARGLPERARVVFRGPVDDVAAEYRRADAFVLPSVSEGMSNALLEALSHGLVCLASDIPENRPLVVDGVSGLLFEQGSPNALAACVRRVWDDALAGGSLGERLRAGARAHIEAGFAPEAIAQRLAGLYAEVLDEQPRRRGGARSTFGPGLPTQGSG